MQFARRTISRSCDARAQATGTDVMREVRETSPRAASRALSVKRGNNAAGILICRSYRRHRSETGNFVIKALITDGARQLRTLAALAESASTGARDGGVPQRETPRADEALDDEAEYRVGQDWPWSRP